MANISSWEKLRKAVGLGYSEKLTVELAKEKAELEAQRKAAREAILAQQAKAKAAEEAYAKAQAEKAAAKIAEVKAAAKPQPKKDATRDGDGDGKINDGTKNEKPAPKKATPKKQAELKAKPAAPTAKKKSGGKGTSTAK